MADADPMDDELGELIAAEAGMDCTGQHTLQKI
jgi:hypothetical protein